MGNEQKKALYEKHSAMADKAIARGDMNKALLHAKEGFELGLELHKNGAAGQYLFCLNELGRFEEALQAAERYWQGAKNDDDLILANTLCAMLAVGTVQAEQGMKLLNRFNLASVTGWRKRFARFNYNPVQTSLVFNAAMILYNAGETQEALQIVKEVMQHMIFFIDSETEGTRNIPREVAETIDEFLSLIDESPEFDSLKNEESFQELVEITENHFAE